MNTTSIIDQREAKKMLKLSCPFILLKHFESVNCLFAFCEESVSHAWQKKGIIVFLGKTQLLNVLLHILGADKHWTAKKHPRKCHLNSNQGWLAKGISWQKDFLDFLWFHLLEKLIQLEKIGSSYIGFGALPKTPSWEAFDAVGAYINALQACFALFPSHFLAMSWAKSFLSNLVPNPNFIKKTLKHNYRRSERYLETSRLSICVQSRTYVRCFTASISIFSIALSILGGSSNQWS